MSRSGYSYGYDEWAMIRWRGAVTSAIRGKRGQAFLKEMLTALDTLEAKRLIRNDLVRDGEVCAIGAVALARKTDVSAVDPEDRDTVANVFGIAPALAAEIVNMNDEYSDVEETPEERYDRMRQWILSEIKAEET